MDADAEGVNGWTYTYTCGCTFALTYIHTETESVKTLLNHLVWQFFKHAQVIAPVSSV